MKYYYLNTEEEKQTILKNAYSRYKKDYADQMQIKKIEK